jgi:hypothetical protein
MRWVPLALIAPLAILAPSRAAAAPPWVDRHLTLPGGDWAFDLGLGVSHIQPAPPPYQDLSGVGMNAEMAVGLTSRVELGVRTGLRFGDAAARSTQGDSYGRLFDRQTFATGADVLANPEVRVRGALVRESIVELGLEGRVVLPFEPGTAAGVLFGLPLAFHLGDRVRLDVGLYVPIVFFRPTPVTDLAIPVDVWIQATRRLWLGPMTGVRVVHIGDAGEGRISLGFGLGYQITHAVDFKAMLLFPGVNIESRNFGAGAGVQIRIE